MYKLLYVLLAFLQKRREFTHYFDRLLQFYTKNELNALIYTLFA